MDPVYVSSELAIQCLWLMGHQKNFKIPFSCLDLINPLCLKPTLSGVIFKVRRCSFSNLLDFKTHVGKEDVLLKKMCR